MPGIETEKLRGIIEECIAHAIRDSEIDITPNRAEDVAYDMTRDIMRAIDRAGLKVRHR
jgi:hypothetical protein